jgi:hypothetical protein
MAPAPLPPNCFPKGAKARCRRNLSSIDLVSRGEHRDGALPDVDDGADLPGVRGVTGMRAAEVGIFHGHGPQSAVWIGGFCFRR